MTLRILVWPEAPLGHICRGARVEIGDDNGAAGYLTEETAQRFYEEGLIDGPVSPGSTQSRSSRGGRPT